MSIEQLAALDHQDRIRVTEAALASSRAALARVQQYGGGRTDAIRANIARLEAHRAALTEAVTA